MRGGKGLGEEGWRKHETQGEGKREFDVQRLLVSVWDEDLEIHVARQPISG